MWWRSGLRTTGRPTAPATAGVFTITLLFTLATPRSQAEDPQDPNFTRRIPPGASNATLNQASFGPRITPDGKFIVFSTQANILNLTPAPTVRQIYRFQRDIVSGNGTLTLLSWESADVDRNGDGNFDDDGDGNLEDPSPSHCHRPSVSDDGKKISFETSAKLVTADTNGLFDIYVRDLSGTPVTRRVSVRAGFEPNGGSTAAVISGNGQKVAFSSVATNLIATDVNGALSDVFIVNADGTGIDIVSVSNNPARLQSCLSGFTTAGGGTLGRVINREGNKVVFHGQPCDWDPEEGACVGFNCLCAAVNQVCMASPADCVNPPACPGAVAQQVYLRDLSLAQPETARVSRRFDAASGTFAPANQAAGSGSISADGRIVAFASTATNLSDDPDSISDIFFITVADDNQNGNLDVNDGFNVQNATFGGDNDSFSPMLSADGDEVGFASKATNLVPGGGTNITHIYLEDIAGLGGPIRRYSVSSGGTAGNNHSTNPAVAGEGKVVVYESVATNLIASDTNGKQDIFETLSRGPFQRGDADGDGTVEDGSGGQDTVFVQAFLFSGGAAPKCLDTADADDSGAINITDVSRLAAMGPYPAPGTTCGNETTGEALTCAEHLCQ